MRITVERKRASRKSRKKREFSKIVLAVVMFLYIIAACYGGVLIYESREYLGEWFAFIGTPTAVAIGYYECKAKNENVKKIEKSDKEEDENANG